MEWAPPALVKTSAGRKVWQQIGERVQRFAQQQVIAAHGRSAIAQFIDEEQILPQLEKCTQGSQACLVEVCTSATRPCPEHDTVYSPAVVSSPEFRAFVHSVRRERLLERIVVCSDGFILSGHRRYAAIGVPGWKSVKIEIRPGHSYLDDRDRVLKLLA